MVQPADGGDVPRAADIEMGPDGLEMDESFLEALPADLREEMMQAQANMARRYRNLPTCTCKQLLQVVLPEISETGKDIIANCVRKMQCI